MRKKISETIDVDSEDVKVMGVLNAVIAGKSGPGRRNVVSRRQKVRVVQTRNGNQVIREVDDQEDK